MQYTSNAHDPLKAFETSVKQIAQDEYRGNTSEAYEVYASRVSAAVDELLETLDPGLREQAIRIAAYHGYEPECDDDIGIGVCSTTGIETHCCHCGRHP